MLPIALFDAKECLVYPKHSTDAYHPDDLKYSLAFLKAYNGSDGTFNSYRREIERLLHWCALIAKKSLKELRRDDFEAYVNFCQHPPVLWIGKNKYPRFLLRDGERVPNPAWRPFIATVSKSARRKGKDPSVNAFEWKQSSLKELFAINSTFFNYLIQEDYAYMNPVALIRQKSKFLQKTHGLTPIRRLSDLQWEYVIQTAKDMAVQDPLHERTLFIMSALYSMYLRISELASSVRWTPRMKDFSRDSEGNWWFTTVGKGNKLRQIAVSEAMLEALKRWRTHLSLSPLPSPADDTPLVPRERRQGAIQSTNAIRHIVQHCFDEAVSHLKKGWI